MKLWRYLLLLPLMTMALPAQAAEPSVADLGKIVITSKRSQAQLGEISDNVTVFTAAEIAQLPARNLSEALRFIPGVDIELREGFGRAASVSIQGCDSRQVRVMIDGIPFNPQSSGQVNLSTFPIENIARIEVIKGAASSLWGSSLGGVINVITKDTGQTLKPQGNFTSTFSEFQTQKQNGEASGKIAGIGYYLFGGYMESAGTGPKDDVLEKKAFTKLSYENDLAGKIIATFGYSQADLNSGEYPDGTWQERPYRARYGKIGWQKQWGDIEVNADFKHSRQDVVTKDYFSLSLDDSEPFWIVRSEDILSQLSINSIIHPRQKDLFVVGADFDWDELESTYLSEPKSLNLQAPYAHYTLKWDPWDFNCGLRYDHTSEFGAELSPAFGAVYHLANIPETLLRAGVSRAFNTPPLLWKYYDPILSGMATNPDISAERAWVYELGMESRPLSWLGLSASLYRADVQDALDLARNSLNQRYMKNFEKFRRQGGELKLKLDLCAGWGFFASGGFNDVEDRATGETVRGGTPRQSFDTGLEYKNESGFSALIRGYYDRWNTEPTVYWDQAGQLITVEPNDRKMLCDLKLSQDIQSFNLFFNIYNLTNSKYWADFYFPAPERYFEGGLTVKW